MTAPASQPTAHPRLSAANVGRPRLFEMPWSNIAPARLTPGTLKLAMAQVAAMSKGTDVAAEIAAQIDFEWEERRWREPAGDAEAVENGMGC